MSSPPSPHCPNPACRSYRLVESRYLDANGRRFFAGYLVCPSCRSLVPKPSLASHLRLTQLEKRLTGTNNEKRND